MKVTVDEVKLKEYNDIPVMYCSRCLSLYILESNDIDYCEKCGSTTIKESHIKD